MVKPSLEEFKALRGQGNLVPIYQELPADLETPVSVYLKLRNGGPTFLLESVERGEQLGRFSFIGVHPPLVLTAHGAEATVASAGGALLQRHTLPDDPLSIVASLLRQRRSIQLPDLPRFTGGAVGFLGYDWVRYGERLPATAPDELHLPDFTFLLADNLVVFDHVRHRLLVLANARLDGDLLASYADAVTRIEAIVTRLRQPLTPPDAPQTVSEAPWRSNFSQAGFEAAVRRAQEYIAAGDIFQVVLSQRLQRETDADPFTIYRALRMLNPSPYMFLLELPNDLRIIGSSPEMHVRLEGRTAQLHPIAGTRRRGVSPADDARLAAELLADPKERAEHVMLVDLGRNDLGRVCDYGTVKAASMMNVERYSHVMHITSDVQGVLRPEQDAFSLLRATFPAGTLSGAPKVRAMEIIEELEGTRRGVYGGCVGYMDYGGAMDTCIAIRTIVMRGKTCFVQAGAGIVADSEPTAEWQECLNKAQALTAAVERAEHGI